MSKLPLALALSLVAAPAFAGPIGSGLWLTESVAKARANAPVAAKMTAADANGLKAVASSNAAPAAVADGKSKASAGAKLAAS